MLHMASRAGTCLVVIGTVLLIIGAGKTKKHTKNLQRKIKVRCICL